MGTDEELQSLRRQLETHKKNLLKLEEQAATYGIAVPLHLSNQIDHEKENSYNNVCPAIYGILEYEG